MSSRDRRPYLTETVLDQDFLNRCQDNLTCQLELVVDIEAPDDSFIRASNRNKYVGSVFYEALLNFPVITRSVGDWLQPQIEFSQLELELNNSTGRFSNYLPGGADFASWIGRSVQVRLGLRDVASTYFTIFKGSVSDVGGFSRSTASIRIVARDDFDRLRKSIPVGVFTPDIYPDIEDGNIGLAIPIIYGDWTVAVTERQGSVPAWVINGTNDNVRGEDDAGNPVARNLPVECVISQTVLTEFQTDSVWLKRGSTTYQINAADVFDVTIDKNRFKIKQDGSGGVTLVEGATYAFQTGDLFFCKVKGKDLGAYDNNIVAIARDLLQAEGGVLNAELDTTAWDAYRDKASPAESAISTFKARVWLQEPVPLIELVLSLLEQVRVEMYQNRDLKLSLASTHFDEFVASPTHMVTNFDLEKGTFKPELDDLTNFNRVQGEYNFLPDVGKQAYQTKVVRNQAAINQAGKEIYKRIVMPNLYDSAVALSQIKETLKISSSYLEHVQCSLTWRALLLDIGDFVKLNVVIGSTELVDVPCLIRRIGYDPSGLQLQMELWSFQMCPFTGYNPGNAGTVGGQFASLIEE